MNTRGVDNYIKLRDLIKLKGCFRNHKNVYNDMLQHMQPIRLNYVEKEVYPLIPNRQSCAKNS